MRRNISLYGIDFIHVNRISAAHFFGIFRTKWGTKTKSGGIFAARCLFFATFNYQYEIKSTKKGFILIIFRPFFPSGFFSEKDPCFIGKKRKHFALFYGVKLYFLKSNISLSYNTRVNALKNKRTSQKQLHYYSSRQPSC